MTRLTISFNDDLYNQIEHQSDEKNISKSELVRKALREYFSNSSVNNQIDESFIMFMMNDLKERLQKKENKINELHERIGKLKHKYKPNKKDLKSSFNIKWSAKSKLGFRLMTFGIWLMDFSDNQNNESPTNQT